jgi:hypothetical protein
VTTRGGAHLRRRRVERRGRRRGWPYRRDNIAVIKHARLLTRRGIPAEGTRRARRVPSRTSAVLALGRWSRSPRPDGLAVLVHRRLLGKASTPSGLAGRAYQHAQPLRPLGYPCHYGCTNAVRQTVTGHVHLLQHLVIPRLRSAWSLRYGSAKIGLGEAHPEAIQGAGGRYDLQRGPRTGARLAPARPAPLVSGPEAPIRARR